MYGIDPFKSAQFDVKTVVVDDEFGHGGVNSNAARRMREALAGQCSSAA